MRRRNGRQQTDKALYDLGVISGLAYKASKGKSDELTTRNGLEGQRLTSTQKAIDSQLAEQQAKVEQMRVLAELKKKQLNALKVRAGIDGVLVELPLHVGEHVSPGAMLAKVVQPNHLMAELKVAETQARDVQIGEPASVDTHNGVISGEVMRVDPGRTKRNGHCRRQTNRRTAQGRPAGSECGRHGRPGAAGQCFVCGTASLRAGEQHDQSFQSWSRRTRSNQGSGESRAGIGEFDPDCGRTA